MFLFKVRFLFVLQFLMADSQGIKRKIPGGICKGRGIMMNDCNICRCAMYRTLPRFVCETRDCSRVDRFGHFKDTIQAINVGMEGHGVWRSSPDDQQCQPGVHYSRDQLLCVCNANGIWPNPICRDVFRVLHEVEIDKISNFTENQKCEASKLYLVECNVCFCPLSGLFDPKLCTNKTCSADDPNLKASIASLANKTTDSSDANEILDYYAECLPNSNYSLGCMNCTCLKNNRLVCGKCNETANSTDNLCSNRKVGETFNIDCNICQCDKNEMLFCTTKRCIPTNYRRFIQQELYDFSDLKAQKTEAPFDNLICEPGTTYIKGCNTCSCLNSGDTKIYVCTLNACENETLSLDTDCVPGTVYKSNCLICTCDVMNFEKRESCRVDHICASKQSQASLDPGETKDVATLNGYCEPLHLYKNDCNTCRCLANGKLLMCTSKICKQPSKDQARKPVIIDVIPIKQENNDCPRGQSYKVDCNFCYCLSNGNALCTTVDCLST